MKISIITITYNAEKALVPTAESVLMQDFSNIEHLIIDGLSKDSTIDVAEEYKHRNDVTNNGHEVIIMSEPDHGIYDAMNKGLRKANGDFIVFLNAGDTLPEKNTISSVAKAAQTQANVAVVYGDTNITDENGTFLRHRRLHPGSKLTWQSFKYGMLVCHQAFYARREIAKDIHYDLQYRHSADVDWCIRIMKDAERKKMPLVYTGSVIANFAIGGNTTQNHRDSLKERFRIMYHHYGIVTTILMHCWFVVRAVVKR